MEDGRRKIEGEKFTHWKEKVARGEGREKEENVHLEEGMSRSGGKREGGNCARVRAGGKREGGNCTDGKREG